MTVGYFQQPSQVLVITRGQLKQLDEFFSFWRSCLGLLSGWLVVFSKLQLDRSVALQRFHAIEPIAPGSGFAPFGDQTIGAISFRVFDWNSQQVADSHATDQFHSLSQGWIGLPFFTS